MKDGKGSWPFAAAPRPMAGSRNTGAWTNMSVEHTARTGADKGFFMMVPEDCCSTMNADWHNASINFALQNVAVVTNADTVIQALD